MLVIQWSAWTPIRGFSVMGTLMGGFYGSSYARDSSAPPRQASNMKTPQPCQRFMAGANLAPPPDLYSVNAPTRVIPLSSTVSLNGRWSCLANPPHGGRFLMMSPSDTVNSSMHR